VVAVVVAVVMVSGAPSPLHPLSIHPCATPRPAPLLLLLPLVAAVSADENTHEELVTARLAPALLPYATDPAAP